MHRLLLYWLSGLSPSVSSFVCKLVSCVSGSLTLCYLYPTGGSIAVWMELINFPNTIYFRH